MNSGPTLSTSRDIRELKSEGYSGPIATGELTSGRPYEIKLSRKSAVADGLHLVMPFPEGVELTSQEEAESLSIFLGFARDLPLAKEFGCRLGINFGEMRTQNTWHAHIIIPGSSAENEAAPRLVDPWKSDA